MGESVRLPKNFYAILKKLIGTLFEKHFTFSTDTSWLLPGTGSFFCEDYSIDSLQALKTKLNAVKSKLNDFPIEDWSAHTRRRNPSGEVVWRMKSAIDAEFVTQAWCKFYECLSRFPVVQDSTLNSVHLCEAPGAFIAALNHYLHSKYSAVKWQWLATTLNPYYEGNALSNMVIDDRFMLHTLDNWNFGEDFTGNILDITNVEFIATRAECLGDIHLVTADGSIDCMETPECQEEAVYPLQYAETCTALRILAPGGCFILKVFTLFEATSVSLLYLLNCTFEKVIAFKPATSKCGNSEVYIICLGFRKDSESFSVLLNVLLRNLDNRQHRPFFRQSDIPQNFIQQVENCARFFMDHQTMVINRNIASYKNPGRGDIKRSRLVRVHVTNHYLNVYNIRRISEDDKILHSNHATVQYYKNSRIYSGSFSERKSLGEKTVQEKLLSMLCDLQLLEDKLTWQFETSGVTLTSSENHQYRNYRGKPISRVCSSLFVNIHLMNFLNKIVNIVPSQATMPIQVWMNSNRLELKENSLSLQRSYHTSEKNFCRELLEEIVQAKPTAVTIHGLPLLTHFIISFIIILSEIYDVVSLDSKCTIVFQSLKDTQLNKLNQNLNVIMKICKNENQNEDVLCMLDMKELHNDEFKKIIMNYNNENCLQFCKKLIDENTK